MRAIYRSKVYIPLCGQLIASTLTCLSTAKQLNMWVALFTLLYTATRVTNSISRIRNFARIVLLTNQATWPLNLPCNGLCPSLRHLPLFALLNILYCFPSAMHIVASVVAYPNCTRVPSSVPQFHQLRWKLSKSFGPLTPIGLYRQHQPIHEPGNNMPASKETSDIIRFRYLITALSNVLDIFKTACRSRQMS